MSVILSASLQESPEHRLVSVILPTYNEAGNIVELVRTIHREIKQPHEIIVVDDNSPDGTSRLVQDVIDCGDVPGLRLETRTADRGFTKSIWRGIELSRGDTIIWMDCDFSMPPEKLPELLGKVEEGYDIAVGSRFVAGGRYKEVTGDGGPEESRLAILLSRFLNWFIRMSLHPGFHDYTSNFVAIRRDVFKKVRLHGDYGDCFMDLMVRSILLGYSFIEIPYICMPRKTGESKTGSTLRQLFRHGFKYLKMIVRLWGVRVKHALGFSIADRDGLV